MTAKRYRHRPVCAVWTAEADLNRYFLPKFTLNPLFTKHDPFTFAAGLERSWLALMITAAGVQLFTILALICGLWPGDCRTIKRSSLYLIASIMSLLAGRFYILRFVSVSKPGRSLTSFQPKIEKISETLFFWTCY